MVLTPIPRRRNYSCTAAPSRTAILSDEDSSNPHAPSHAPQASAISIMVHNFFAGEMAGFKPRIFNGFGPPSCYFDDARRGSVKRVSIHKLYTMPFTILLISHLLISNATESSCGLGGRGCRSACVREARNELGAKPLHPPDGTVLVVANVPSIGPEICGPGLNLPGIFRCKWVILAFRRREIAARVMEFTVVRLVSPTKRRRVDAGSRFDMPQAHSNQAARPGRSATGSHLPSGHPGTGALDDLLFPLPWSAGPGCGCSAAD